MSEFPWCFSTQYCIRIYSHLLFNLFSTQYIDHLERKSFILSFMKEEFNDDKVSISSINAFDMVEDFISRFLPHYKKE
jgi:hypothetical protein